MAEEREHWCAQKPYSGILAVVGILLALFLVAKTWETVRAAQQVGKPDPFEHTIIVDGEEKYQLVPDIATVTAGIDSKAPTVADAQKKNSDAMNGLIAKIKGLGIPEADIQTTSYNVYEDQQWNPDTQTYASKGWVVSQQVTVTVRDVTKVSMVLETAGQNGATNVYGPNFRVDDTSGSKDAARAAAIADAAQRASAISRTLGVRLERVVGYSEWLDSGMNPQPYYAMDKAAGMGGAAPAIQPGQEQQTLHVQVTYKIVD